MHWPAPITAQDIEHDRGPVLVTVEYRIRPQDRDAFLDAIAKLEPERRRDGAYRWGVFEDAAEEGRIVEIFLVASWMEHLRQHERVTNADRLVQEAVHKFSAGRRAQGDPFHRRRHLTLQPSGCGTLSIDRPAKVRHYPRGTEGEREIMAGKQRVRHRGAAVVVIAGVASLLGAGIARRRTRYRSHHHEAQHRHDQRHPARVAQALCRRGGKGFRRPHQSRDLSGEPARRHSAADRGRAVRLDPGLVRTARISGRR